MCALGVSLSVASILMTTYLRAEARHSAVGRRVEGLLSAEAVDVVAVAAAAAAAAAEVVVVVVVTVCFVRRGGDVVAAVARRGRLDVPFKDCKNALLTAFSSETERRGYVRHRRRLHLRPGFPWSS